MGPVTRSQTKSGSRVLAKPLVPLRRSRKSSNAGTQPPRNRKDGAVVKKSQRSEAVNKEEIRKERLLRHRVVVIEKKEKKVGRPQGKFSKEEDLGERRSQKVLNILSRKIASYAGQTVRVRSKTGISRDFDPKHVFGDIMAHKLLFHSSRSAKVLGIEFRTIQLFS